MFLSSHFVSRCATILAISRNENRVKDRDEDPLRNNLPTNNIGESTSDKLIGSRHPLISRHSTPNAWTTDLYAFMGGPEQRRIA